MRLLIVGLLLGLVACGNPQPFAPEIQVPLDQPFALRVGQSAELSGTRLRLRFEQVREDSRCPADVVCVWGGNARMRLTIDADGEVGSLELNTGLDPREVETNGFVVSAEGLQPEPRTSVAIEPTDYVVSLRVSRVP